MSLPDQLETVVASAIGVGDWFAMFDADAHCTRLNRGALGFVPGALIGLERPAGPPAELPAATREIIDAVLGGGEPYDTELDYADPGFGPRSFAFQFRALRAGERIVGVLVRSSETTQHRMHARATRMQARLLEAMSDAVLVVDATRTIRFANRACEPLLGRSAGQLVGEPLGVLGEALATYVRRAAEVAIDGRPSPPTTLVLPPPVAGAAAPVVRCRTTAMRIDRLRHDLVVLTDVTEMRRLEREVLDAERRERERLARDLHDGIGQELTGIALMLRVLAKQISASSPECAGQVEQLVEAVNGLVQSSRTLTHGIFGAPVAGAGLEAALDGLARRASERSGIPVRFSAHGARARRIEEGVAEQLYRIAQEATTNALRHSHASSVDIDLRVEDATLRLAVSDDGVGLPPESAATGAGSGLRIMQFRAHAAGGELRIGPRRVAGQDATAAPRRPGTTVECSLVLPPVAAVH